MATQLAQAKIFPIQDSFHDTGDEGTGRQHQRWIRREICSHFKASFAWANADGAALPVCRQQKHWHGKNVCEQKGQFGRIAGFRFPRIGK